MNCVILQPSYIPWRGYFHQMRKADVFVFFDDVQYTKKSWRSRNRIKGRERTQWLTIPVHARGSITNRTPIKDIRIDWTTAWNVYHREKLREYYERAPFYGPYSELLDRLYATRAERLADFTIASSIELARALSILDTRFVRSSELDAPGEGTGRVLSILRRVGASHLINGPTARAYTDESLLTAAGITIEYMRYDYPPYPQLAEPFDPQVSILDLLLMVGPDAPRYIWG